MFICAALSFKKNKKNIPLSHTQENVLDSDLKNFLLNIVLYCSTGTLTLESYKSLDLLSLAEVRKHRGSRVLTTYQSFR